MITSLMFARILYHLFYRLNIHSHQNNPVFHLLSHQLRFQKKTVFRRFFGGTALLLPGNTHLPITYKFFCSDRNAWPLVIILYPASDAQQSPPSFQITPIALSYTKHIRFI